MKLYEITLKEGYDTLTTISISGQKYDIYLKWLNRDESFEMKFGVQGDLPVCYAKLTTNVDILGKVRYMEKMPQGLLTVADTLGGTGRISYGEFGSNKRYRLVYMEATDGA